MGAGLVPDKSFELAPDTAKAEFSRRMVGPLGAVAASEPLPALNGLALRTAQGSASARKRCPVLAGSHGALFFDVATRTPRKCSGQALRFGARQSGRTKGAAHSGTLCGAFPTMS